MWGDITISSDLIYALTPGLIVAALSLTVYLVRHALVSSERFAQIAQALVDIERRMQRIEDSLDRKR